MKQSLNHGMIGNCRTGALVSNTGTIEWLCMPFFNSPSVFAHLLDTDKGGEFRIIVDPSYVIEQSYIRNTNLLRTRFSSGQDVFEVIDFMPLFTAEYDDIYAHSEVVRYFKHISGKPSFRLKYNPQLEYARFKCVNSVHTEYLKTVTVDGDYDSLYLYSDFTLDDIITSRELFLTKDQFCLVSYDQKLLEQDIHRQYLKLERTKVYWLNWTERVNKFKYCNAEIIRSSLTLKMLTFKKTGAVLAALTTSLPETIGEVRNWDYRFCWVRDSSMVVRVFANLGHHPEAKAFLQYMLRLIPDKGEKIQIMYGINGEKTLTESSLDHLSGYNNSRPVRIGNEAYSQKQNDIYGILLDIIFYQFSKFSSSLEESEQLWTVTRGIMRTVRDNWKLPDRGIWELRTEQRHFTFSKMLCWMAADRASRVADILHKTSYQTKWELLRDEIKQDIEKNSWNEELQAYTQSYGDSCLDASTLLMCDYGFIEADNPRFISTVQATYRDLSKNGLMFRYKNADDFGEPSSSFTICTFWMIRSLFLIGERRKAKEIFETLLTYSNHLGLFSEDIDFETKELLGNFPQAYSHLALIETAILLNDDRLEHDSLLLGAIRK